jgi:hypothetical protein
MMHLISERPWSGWGWGELDYAHFVTSYEVTRQCELLDNAHNLPLHLAVELGLPVALLFCAAGIWLIWRAKAWRDSSPSRRLAWTVLALVGSHSMVEYPLWYGPFQLAAVLSLIVLVCRSDNDAQVSSMFMRAAGVVTGVGAFLIVVATYVGWDYYRVSQIYLPHEQRAAAYRDDTLQKIRGSWLFRDQVRFAELSLTPLTPQNAQHLNALAHQLLHFSPEARVVEKLIESALLLGREEEARAFMQRYQAAYPQAYAQWISARRP